MSAETASTAAHISPATDVVERYLACWNETDTDARRRLAEALFAADVRYVDPLADAVGLDALVVTIGAVQAQFAGMVFAALGQAESHHDVVRFRWALGPVGAEPLAEGADVAQLDADGRVTLVIGFLDRLPS